MERETKLSEDRFNEGLSALSDQSLYDAAIEAVTNGRWKGSVLDLLNVLRPELATSFRAGKPIQD